MFAEIENTSVSFYKGGIYHQTSGFGFTLFDCVQCWVYGHSIGRRGFPENSYIYTRVGSRKISAHMAGVHHLESLFGPRWAYGKTFKMKTEIKHLEI